MTLSRHAGPSPVRDRFSPAAPDSATLFRARRSPTFHRRRWPRARPPFTRAATLFGALRTSVFGTERRRLTTSATAMTCGHFDLDSRNPRRDDGLDRLPFLHAHHAAPLAGPVMRDEPRSARLTPPRCRFILVAQVCPTALRRETRDPETVLPPRVEPRLTCTGLRTE
jgi:hypothetical protein